jgi:DNA-binding CsgD family transcriptional regulator
VLAHRGDTGAALAELHRAIDHHSLRPVALERDRTLRERQRLEHPGGGVVTGRGPLERPALPGATERLSRRERELLGLLAEGLTDAQIAQRLYISVRTVHSHLDRIRDKTGARRRAELTRLSLSLQP